MLFCVFVCHTLPLDEAFYRGLHLPMPWLWGAIAVSGASGVDLFFFALSAFLITSLLLRERQETGETSLRLFYIRRSPAHLAAVLSRHCHGCFTRTHCEDSKPRLVLRSKSSLVLRRWLSTFCRQLGVRRLGTTHSICAPLWTVSIEEQFYLVWPAVMKLLKRRGMIIAGVITFLMATASQGRSRAGRCQREVPVFWERITL